MEIDGDEWKWMEMDEWRWIEMDEQIDGQRKIEE
jgi:hypothetical protein|tara:strand:+ start:354 stop:455 length:102 start_codon:yes stop_codon:yes gene_type:complete